MACNDHTGCLSYLLCGKYFWDTAVSVRIGQVTLTGDNYVYIITNIILFSQ